MKTAVVFLKSLYIASLVVSVYSVGEVVDCPQLAGPDVTQAQLTLVDHSISEKASSTACMTFQVPSDQDYHLIATTAVVDNKDLVTGMDLFALLDDSEVTDASQTTVSDCSGPEYKAQTTLVGFWSKGRNGLCYGDNGFRFGKTTFKYVYIKVFYANPSMKKRVTDRSGMGVYFKAVEDDTSKDLAIVALGTTLLEIPPGNASYVAPTYCKGGCTQKLVKENAKIMGAFGHMGPLGASARIELFRNGEKVADVAYDKAYDYENVTLQTHTPSLDLFPGDELRASCVYNTTTKTNYVRWGSGPGQESCFGFLFVYPRSAIDLNYEYCFSFAQLDVCEVLNGEKIITSMGECDWVSFIDTEKSDWVDQVSEDCGEDGYCSARCKETVRQLIEKEPCLSMEASLYINYALQNNIGHRELAAVNTCRGLLWSEMSGQGNDQGNDHAVDSCSCAPYCP